MAISAKEAIERVERQQKRIKRQNEHIKENYDRVSVTLPKGTKQRINGIGESINGFIGRLVSAELDRLEQLKPEGEKPEQQDNFSDVPFMK